MTADHIALVVGSGMVTAVAVWFTQHHIDWWRVLCITAGIITLGALLAL